MAPLYEKLAAEHIDSIKFLEVDIDPAPEITNRESIQSVPMFLFYDHGVKRTILEVRGANSSLLVQNVKLFVAEVEAKVEAKKQQVVIISASEPTSDLAQLASDEPSSDSELEFDEDSLPEYLEQGSSIDTDIDPDSDPGFEPDSDLDEPIIEKTIPDI